MHIKNKSVLIHRNLKILDLWKPYQRIHQQFQNEKSKRQLMHFSNNNSAEINLVRNTIP